MVEKKNELVPLLPRQSRRRAAKKDALCEDRICTQHRIWLSEMRAPQHEMQDRFYTAAIPRDFSRGKGSIEVFLDVRREK